MHIKKMSIFSTCLSMIISCGSGQNLTENTSSQVSNYKRPGVCYDEAGPRFDYLVGFGSEAELANLAAKLGDASNKKAIISYLKKQGNNKAVNDCGKCGFFNLGSQAFFALSPLRSKIADGLASAGWWAVRVSGNCKRWHQGT